MSDTIEDILKEARDRFPYSDTGQTQYLMARLIVILLDLGQLVQSLTRE